MKQRSKTTRRGFTIVEASLFLAISGLMVAGILAGATTSIIRHRYVDAANDLASYLRSAYSEVINVENTRATTDKGTLVACSISGFAADLSKGSSTTAANNDQYPGRSNCAIYGKLLTFGEPVPNDDAHRFESADTIHSYDIVGRVYTPEELKKVSANSDTLTALKSAYIDVATVSNSDDTTYNLALAGNSNFYNPQWEASLDAALTSDRSDYQPLTGALMIVRSPVTGTVHTYYSPAQFRIAEQLAQATSANSANSFASYGDKFLGFALNSTDSNTAFTARELVMCLNSPDLSIIGHRRAIRVDPDGRNATAVNLLSADDDLVVNSETGLCR